MKLYLDVVYGQDTPAYYTADLEIDVPDGLIGDPDRPTAEELAHPAVVQAATQAARAAAPNIAGNGMFVPSWDCTGLRIVSIRDNQTEQALVHDIVLEASGEDLGLAAKLVLQGMASPNELLREADRQGIEVCEAMRKLLQGAGAQAADA